MTLPPPSPRLITPEDVTDPDIRALVEAIAHVGPLIRETVAIPGSDRPVVVIRPQDIDTLLDQSEHDPEQNLPYWAEIWPSGIALASAMLMEPERISGQTVVEVGSGVGITAAVAVELGAHLLATDYSPESVLLTRLTSRIHTGREPETRQVNWRAPDADLFQADGSGWPVVLAADVLYEQRDIDPVLDLFERILAPGGLVWLADPGRRPAKEALERARNRGWTIESSSWPGPWPDPKDASVVVQVHQMRRGISGSIDNQPLSPLQTRQHIIRRRDLHGKRAPIA